MPEPFDLDPVATAWWAGYAQAVRDVDDEREAADFERELRRDPDSVDG